MKVRLLSLFTLLVLSFGAQRAAAQTSSDWVPYFEDDQVKIELRQAHRADSANDIYNNYLLLRLTNKVASPVTLSFDKQLEYNLVPVAGDAVTTFTLGPQQVVEGSVDNGTNKALRIFVNQYKGRNKKVLTSWSIANIQSTVNPN